jgi:hypothetical protein
VEGNVPARALPGAAVPTKASNCRPVRVAIREIGFAGFGASGSGTAATTMRSPRPFKCSSNSEITASGICRRTVAGTARSSACSGLLSIKPSITDRRAWASCTPSGMSAAFSRGGAAKKRVVQCETAPAPAQLRAAPTDVLPQLAELRGKLLCREGGRGFLHVRRAGGGLLGRRQARRV